MVAISELGATGDEFQPQANRLQRAFSHGHVWNGPQIPLHGWTFPAASVVTCEYAVVKMEPASQEAPFGPRPGA
jgi:hypothetical protein